MEKRFVAFFIVAVMGVTLFFSPATAGAKGLSDQVKGNIGAAGSGGELGDAVAPQIIVASIIEVLLTFVGMIFLVLMIMAGYWRVTSHGDEARISMSTKTMQAAVVGIIITLSAYAITSFVAKRAYNETRGDEVYEINEDTPNQVWKAEVNIPIF